MSTTASCPQTTQDDLTWKKVLCKMKRISQRREYYIEFTGIQTIKQKSNTRKLKLFAKFAENLPLAAN